MKLSKEGFVALKVLLFALGCAALAFVIFSKPSTRFRCECYDTGRGLVMVNVRPLSGCEFPPGDFEIEFKPCAAGSVRTFVGNLLSDSQVMKISKDEVEPGGIWLVCPMKGRVQFGILGLNSLEFYIPEDGECGKRRLMW